MTRRAFSREFKHEALELITKRGVSTALASRDLGRHATVLRRWVRQAAFRARLKRRQPPTDEGTRSIIAANVLEREFDADSPNQKWVADFTYIWTAEGWLYVVSVIDLFSRRDAGWSMSDQMTSLMVTVALIMAIWRRDRLKELLHHSDQGRQYISEPFQRLMADHGITCSMSRSGNIRDTDAMESFFSALKTERVRRKT